LNSEQGPKAIHYSRSDPKRPLTPSDPPSVLLTQDYDAADNREKLTAEFNGTTDFVTTFDHDALNRVEWITQTASPTAPLPVGAKKVHLTYDAVGQFDLLTRYADLAATQVVAVSDYTFDAVGRMTDLSHTKRKEKGTGVVSLDREQAVD
jgi:hypothetical protein